MPRATFAEIASVRVLADQIDQRCPAEIARELPGRSLVQPHQRRVQFESRVHAEIERALQRPNSRIATIRITGIIGLAHAAYDVTDASAVGQRSRERQEHQIATGYEGVGQAILPIAIATSRVSAVSEISAKVGIASVWLSPSFAAQSARNDLNPSSRRSRHSSSMAWRWP